MDYLLPNGWIVVGDEDQDEWYMDEQWNDRHIIQEVWSSCAYDACLDRSATVIVDVGAHKGYFALRACSLLPTATVHCYEPDPRSARILVENAKRNGVLSRIRLFCEAVGERNGTTTVWLDRRSGKSCLQPLVEDGAPLAFGGRTQRSCPMVSLNTVLQRTEGTAAAIKMDIEGAEFDVFSGVSPENLRHVASIALEYHAGWGEVDELDQLFGAAGFAVARKVKPPMLIATR
jgi:FkbM family methyltransferase